jgi:hypothetical protein
MKVLQDLQNFRFFLEYNNNMGVNRIDRRLVLFDCRQRDVIYLSNLRWQTLPGNSYVTSEGNLVLDGAAVEFAEPVLMAA